MIRIICPKCKNAYLQKADGNLTCPSCEAVFSEKDENLLTGIQYYNEGDFENAKDYLMKYIVQEGAEPRAMFVKALCDATEYDEDTYSLKGLYEKLAESLAEIDDEWFVEYLGLANDETAKIEKSVAEKHIALFEDADAEKIKKEVTTIITLQNDAKDFRKKLTDFAYDYNNRAENTITVRFSECFLVEPEIADEVGNRKYEKILNNIASHTVFTGSLSTDIKNLEIYYRCIVMFFRRNRQKYDFLMASAEKFVELSKRLEEGQYNTIKGTSTIGDKLKSAAYDFFQESLKDHDEDDEKLQTETVVVHEPEIIEIPAEATVEEATEEAETQEFEDISSSSVADEATEETEDEPAEEEIIDISSVSEEASEEEVEENSEADEEVSEADEEISEEDTAEEVIEETEKETSEPASDEEITDDSEEIVAEVVEIEDEEETNADEKEDLSNTAALTKIDKANVDVIPDDEKEDVEGEEAQEEEKPVRKHKTHYAPFVAILLIILGIGAIIAIRVIPPKLKADKYDKAAAYVQQEQYDKAAALYKELGNYEDSYDLYLQNTYAYASQLEGHGRYAEAKDVYVTLGDYKDSALKAQFCIYNDAMLKLNDGKYDEAKTGFDSIPEYADSAVQSQKCLYKKAESLIANHNFVEAVAILETITSYDESVNDMILDAQYRYVKEHLDPEDETTQTYILNLTANNYLDSKSLAEYLASGQTDTPPEGGNDLPVDGQDTPATGTVTIYANTSKSDTETSVTEFDSDRAIYIHVDCLDESLYDQQLTMSYENTYFGEKLGSKTFTAEDSSYVFTYGGDGTHNYDINFILTDASGNVVAEYAVSVN